MKIAFNSIKAVENGSYQARFDGIDPVDSKFGAAYRLRFAITDGKFKGSNVSGVCSQSVAPSSKFYSWISAISGGELKPGTEIETDALVGNLCTVLVEQKQDGERTYSNVTSVIPHQGEDDASGEDDTGGDAAAEADPDVPF